MPAITSANSSAADAPIIIIGAARSGTNMLRDALTTIPGVTTWPCDEINYIWRHFNSGYPHDQFTAEQATPRVCGYLRRQFAKCANSRGTRWIVEKTCANSLRVDFVRAVFPNARFVFLVRDGRDVVASAMKRWTAGMDPGYLARKARFVPVTDLPRYATRYLRHRLQRLMTKERRLGSWGPRFVGIDRMLATHTLAEVCAEQWRQSVLSSARSLAQLSASQVYVATYEQIVSTPRPILTELTEQLAIDVTPTAIARITATISPRSVGNWHRDLSDHDMERIEPVVQQTFDELQQSFPETRGRAA